MPDPRHVDFELGPDRPRKRVSGPRVVLVGFLIILAITSFVVWRIVVTSGTGPDPSTIPQRPSRATGDSL